MKVLGESGITLDIVGDDLSCVDTIEQNTWCCSKGGEVIFMLIQGSR